MKYLAITTFIVTIISACVVLRTENNLISIHLLRGEDPSYFGWWLILIFIVVVSVVFTAVITITMTKENNF